MNLSCYGKLDHHARGGGGGSGGLRRPPSLNPSLGEVDLAYFPIRRALHSPPSPLSLVAGQLCQARLRPLLLQGPSLSVAIRKGRGLKFVIDVGLHFTLSNAGASGSNAILYVCKQKEGWGEVWWPVWAPEGH